MLETWNSLLILLSWRNWLDVTTIAWFGRKNSWFKHVHHINHSFSILNCGYLNSSHTAWLVWTLETWNSLLIFLSWRNWLDVTAIAWFGRKNSWFKHIHHINHSFPIMYLLELWLLEYKQHSLTRINAWNLKFALNSFKLKKLTRCYNNCLIWKEEQLV